MSNSNFTLPILYSFRRCPYAMRARMALLYSGCRVELREIELKNKPSSMIMASPKGTVPVLCLGENKVIDESVQIMRWALSKKDEHHWYCGLPQQVTAKMDALIVQNDDSFKTHLDNYKYSSRFPEHSPEFYRSQCDHFLHVLESMLSEHPFLFGGEITLADIAIFPFIRQFSLVDISWFNQAGYINVQRWLNVLSESTLFKLVMVKYTPWLDAPPSATAIILGEM